MKSYPLAAALLLFAFAPTYAQPLPAAELMTCDEILAALPGGKYSRDIAKYADAIAAVEKDLEGLDYAGVIPWDKKDRYAVKRFMANNFGMDFLNETLPPFNKAQRLGKQTVKIKDIHWSQIHARNMSQDGKYTVINNAKAFKAGTLKVEQLPTLRVWRDTQGRIWTLDHRRLAAMRLSGAIEDLEVEFVAEEIVKDQASKFSTRNEGQSMFVDLDDDVAIVISNVPLKPNPANRRRPR